jgi:hypothetical protein
MHKLIIAGGRFFSDYELLKHEVKKFIVEEIKTKKNLEIVSGKAKGADRLGEQFAAEFGIQVKQFPANWNEHGKKAGPMRNEKMAQYATGEYCICFWDGSSRGTENMIENAKKYGLSLRVVRYDQT